MAPEFDLPRYSQSQRPTLLCLDGGGTRVISQLYMLAEIMHRLHWDLRDAKPRSRFAANTTLPRSAPLPVPADCFDYIGGGGMGSLTGFLLACGYSVDQAREKFFEIVPRIVDLNENLQSVLESVVPTHINMWYQGAFIVDLPTKCNVWVYTPSEERVAGQSQGDLIRRGEPVIKNLIPLVIDEIRRELNGQADTLNYTLPFLQSICPVFDDCSLLLSLGSGDVCFTARKTTPTPPPRPYSPLSYLPNPMSWISTPPPPAPTPAPVVSARQTLQDIRALNEYIPTYAYGRSYIRLQPLLMTWTLSGEQGSPADWESTQFGEHKMLVSGFCGKTENARLMDAAVEIMKRRDFGGERTATCGQEANASMQSLIFESARYIQ